MRLFTINICFSCGSRRHPRRDLWLRQGCHQPAIWTQHMGSGEGATVTCGPPGVDFAPPCLTSTLSPFRCLKMPPRPKPSASLVDVDYILSSLTLSLLYLSKEFDYIKCLFTVLDFYEIRRLPPKLSKLLHKIINKY